MLTKFSQITNQIFVWIAGCLLVGMILLTSANIFLRLVHVPILGTYELMGFFGAVVSAFALGYTQQKRGHVAVDVLIHKFPKSVQKRLQGINSLVCIIFFGLIAWQITLKATNLMKSGEVTETLRIIYYPFTYAVAIGCAGLSLVFLAELVHLLFGKKGGTD